MVMSSWEVLRFERRFRPEMDIFVNRANEGFQLPQHSHDAYELSYVTEGAGFHYVNDVIVPVGRGDLFLIPEGTGHVFRPSSPNQACRLAVINCVFRLEAARQCPELPAPGTRLERVLLQPHALSHPWIHLRDQHHVFYELFHSLLTEYRQALPGYRAVVQALFQQILALLHRHVETDRLQARTDPRLEEALHYIKRTFHCELTLKAVADHSFMSISHLHKLIKQATGSTFTHYLQSLRIKRSCELLLTSAMTVQGVAEAVGYRDMKFFHKLFRERTGLTPNEYRKQERTARQEEPYSTIV